MTSVVNSKIDRPPASRAFDVTRIRRADGWTSVFISVHIWFAPSCGRGVSRKRRLEILSGSASSRPSHESPGLLPSTHSGHLCARSWSLWPPRPASGPDARIGRAPRAGVGEVRPRRSAIELGRTESGCLTPLGRLSTAWRLINTSCPESAASCSSGTRSAAIGASRHAGGVTRSVVQRPLKS